MNGVIRVAREYRGEILKELQSNKRKNKNEKEPSLKKKVGRGYSSHFMGRSLNGQ